MEKYTVIIPTRDRAETLEATLRTCLRQTYENFEIIVSDNCSSDNTKNIVACLNDSRIKYVNPGKRLSMAGNFEFALGHATDGFVMFIGSDDGIMPGAINYVNSIVDTYKVDAVSCRQASYVWPNFPDASIAGRLIFGSVRNDIEIRRASEWIEKTLAYRVQYCFDLPNLYCGFVHRRVINKAIKDGKYFRSITPDAYSAFATALFVDRYAFSHKPFSIAGASVKSNGASAMHPVANNAEAAKFHVENDIEFSDGFVNCPSYEIILTETFAKLSDAFPELCNKYHIDYEAMLRTALANTNARTRDEIGKAVSKMAANFNVDLDKEINQSKSRSTNRNLIEIFKRSFVNIVMPRAVAVRQSGSIGVKDVDDAALVAYVLSELSSDGLTTTRKLINERFKKITKN